jgi:DNA-directed RNA polymerase III subunit RPC11
MLFCALCLNSLSVEIDAGKSRFKCKSCPYTCEVPGVVVEREKSGSRFRIEPEIVKGRALPTRGIGCPRCDGGNAYYCQMQTRSADEPMTIFNTCTSCDHTWRE